MTSEIRTNTLTSRAGLSTVTLTDSGPIFSGITTFVDNSGFNLGTGSSIFTPASNTLTFGTNSKERIKVDSNGRLLLGTVRTYGTGPYYDDICINNSDGSGSAGGAGIDLISKSDNYGAIVFSNESQHERGYIKFEHASGVNKLRFGTLGTDRWQIYSGGNLQPAADSAYDIGSNSVRVRNVYADTLYGDGSNLTGITGTTINGNTDHYLITGTGTANTLQGEATLTYDGNQLNVVQTTSSSDSKVVIANSNTPGSGDLRLEFQYGTGTTEGTNRYRFGYVSGYRQSGSNDGGLIFGTKPNNAGAPTERLRIDSSGNVNIGAKDYNTHSATIDSLQIGHALNLYEDSYSSGTDNYVVFANNLYYNSGNKYMRNDEASRIMMRGGEFYFQNAVAGTAGNAITLVDVLRITSGGNLIIGHTSGSNKLQIGNTGHSGYAIAANSPSYGAVIQVGDGATPGTAAALWIRNLNNGGGTESCFRVQGDATTHFGNQTSTGKYSDGVQGCSWYDDKNSWQQGQSGAIGWSMMYFNKIGHTNVDNRIMQFNSSGSNIGYINRNGGNTQFATSSDYRLKKDIVALPNGLERVKQLRPVAFKWIADNSDMEGFVAHEAQEVCPYAVTGTKDEVALEDHGDRKKGDMIVQAVDYGEFTPLLTAAMKELITKVETLEQENIALRARVTNLEGN